MEYLVTAEEMKACDHAAIHGFGVPSMVLMERAALACADEVCRYCAENSSMSDKGRDRRILILSGCGNNGGDGLAVGRLLIQRGYRTDIVLLGRSDPFRREKCSAETAQQLHILEQYGYPVMHELPNREYDVIVDALTGIGLGGELDGNYRRAVEWINARPAWVLSVDIPSGIHTDTGAVCGCAVRADRTVTFAFRKLGLLLYPGAAYAGKVITAQIGITQDGFYDKKPSVFTYTEEIASLLPPRRADGNKGSFGKVLLAAGSEGMAGAAVLAGRAVLHAGAGMVRILTPEANRVILQTALPEAMLMVYDAQGYAAGCGTAEPAAGTTAAEADGKAEAAAKAAVKAEAAAKADGKAETPGAAASALAWADAAAVGPGLGTQDIARSILKQIIESSRIPLVVDADAINLLAQDTELLERLRFLQSREETRRPLIFTPHPGELGRLEGCTAAQAVRDAFAVTRKWAADLHAAFLCKGARTVVSAPDGRSYLNESGNDGMATAGSGDVLTGILAGLLAQGMDAFGAACAGVYLHGLAGDAAVSDKSPYGLTAGDLIRGMDACIRSCRARSEQ